MTLLDDRPRVDAYAWFDTDLPPVLACERDAGGMPLHGAPGTVWSLLPGDYLLDCGVWLRVAFVTAGAVEPGRALVEFSGGARMSVDADRSVRVWRSVDVLAWAALAETAGGVS